jgi:uncharacterized protein YjiS (DUF1127 family)
MTISNRRSPADFGSNQLRVNAMSIHVYHPYSVTARLAIGPRAHTILASIADAFSAWQERASQRRTLARLDDRLLRDMGLSRADVEHEVSKPFWQA